MHLRDVIDWLIIVAIFMVLVFLVSLWVAGYRKSHTSVLETIVEPHSLFLKANIPPCYVQTTDLGTRTVTAYSSTPEETDDTPFITASGQTVRSGIVATNELAFGTLVKIDGKVYEVQDRTNARYQYLYDIWMPSKQEALDWGKRTLKIELAY